MSAPGPFRIEPLSADHDRAQFTSGSAPLDRYFREQASQDIKRRIAACFVALNLETQEIAGFYTLTATSVPLDALAPEIVKKLPRYPVVPAALLGRLAIAKTVQGKGRNLVRSRCTYAGSQSSGVRADVCIERAATSIHLHRGGRSL